jgi:hypothetical protein
MAIAAMDDHRDPFEPLTDQERKAARVRESTPDGELIVPIPADAPPPPLQHKRLGSCICAVAYGRQPSAVTAGGSSEELEKRISAALLEGGPAVLLDNFNNITLRSASLDSALTERPSKVRQFRTLELVTINTVASVFVTGNGVLLAQDTVRRFVPTELDARMEDPERRSFPGDILADVTLNRPTILVALLTIWRHGRISTGIQRGIVLGSYERWCGWARDPMLSLGCRDPVERLSETKTRDPMRQMIGDLFAVWWNHHGSSPQTAHGLDLEGQKIIDPHGRGRQYVAAQLEKLAGTRVAGFVLTRQAPAGKWGAATYALSKSITEEAKGTDALKDEPKPYAPYDAYDFRVGSNEDAAPLGAQNAAPGAQDDQEIRTEREAIGFIGGIGPGNPSSTPSAGQPPSGPHRPQRRVKPHPPKFRQIRPSGVASYEGRRGAQSGAVLRRRGSPERGRKRTPSRGARRTATPPPSHPGLRQMGHRRCAAPARG